MPSVDGHDIVVGSDGFLGKRLCARLQGDGRRVTKIGRTAGDLSEWDAVEAAFRSCGLADRIFHVVTKQRTGSIQYDIQGDLLTTNARIHLNILQGWRDFQPGAKLISTGSSCTYPESPTPLPESLFGLGPTHRSVRGYALAKQMLAVGSLEYAHQYKMTCLVCVLATLYGPGDHKQPDRSHFVGALLDRAISEKAAGAQSFQVWGDPSTVREILYVDDQIDAILAADGSFENEILNCAANTPITVGEVATAVLDALGWDAPITSPPQSFQGAPYKMLDSTRFLSRTGWKPRFSTEAGLKLILTSDYTAA